MKSQNIARDNNNTVKQNQGIDSIKVNNLTQKNENIIL